MSRAHSPEIRARNRKTLLVCAIVIVCLGVVPLIDRLLTAKLPHVDSMARSQYPPAQSRTDLVTVYAEQDDPLVALIALRLPQLRSAAAKVFPDAVAPFEIVLFQDRNKYDKAWIQTFPGTRIESSIGRAGFVWYLTSGPDEATVPRQSIPEQTGRIWQCVGDSLLESQLLERLRLVPDSYRALIAEMFVVAIDPAQGQSAQSSYDELRATEPAPSEHDWLNGFGATQSPMHKAVTTLMARALVNGRSGTELIELIQQGEELQTAFRAACVGTLPRDQTTGAPSSAVSGTSISALLGRIEQASAVRRAKGSSPDG